MRFTGKVYKVFHDDLVAANVVRNRPDQHYKIKAGILPPPHKDGESKRSAAWWWPEEIDAAMDRERERFAAMEASKTAAE
ncbi:hypothetical protein GOD82_15065 [Sinorhizobium medicae]|uniref:hypothetical protein n=1 Tax=Sinorhizobium medicae TaxID=110321 RepID=UPI001184287E|nr:hypothetical protein [Sinorhizobium medicae]MDX0831242.1 hypothetical protein [Sinorhizobium medicae]UFX00316.1 hypothetical protein SmedWSM1115_10870 [Sinorhizobium medicae WSM1115]